MPVLLLATVILWVAGLILLIVARLLKPPPALEATEPPAWEWILRSIFAGIIAAINKITNPSGTWELIEGVGGLFMWLGVLTLLGFIVVDFLKLLPGGQPTPSAQPSPST